MFSVKPLLIAGLLAATVLFASAAGPSVDDHRQAAPLDTVRTLVDALRQLHRIDLLPRYRAGSVVAQVSSYDTTGGNDDGFRGTYSYVRCEGEHLVLADLEGPGVVQRIWTPTPTSDTLAFYFDGEDEARLRIPFDDLFSGDVFPFVEPVVGNEIGGYYSYVPIPYDRSLKIVFEGDRMRFHQIQYRRYPDHTSAESFWKDWSPAERAELERIRHAWRPDGVDVKTVAAQYSRRLQHASREVELAPGESTDLFRMEEGGRIVGIQLELAEVFVGPYRDLILHAHWDGEARPAIHSPAADFFGFAYGEPAMQSLLLGTRDGMAYSYLPMPFDRSASLQLSYAQRPGVEQAPVRLHARVYYLPVPRDPAAEGKLYAVWRREIDPPAGEPYLMLDAQGRGHHVATVLQTQGLEPGMTTFFEGDDVAVIDGVERVHGTGSEDYFNGGWYALLDRWDRGVSLPLHGALDYSLPMSRTGGYRLHLADKVSFEEDYRFTIEHGPEGNAEPVDYTSVAFYYGDTPPADVMTPTQANRTVPQPNMHVFFPQLMRVTLGPGTTLTSLGRRGLEVTSRQEGMMRVELDEVPSGRYRVLLSYRRAPNGASFSIWQRQRRVSRWQETAAPTDTLIERQAVGEVQLTDQVKTLTLRTRPNDGSETFHFHRLMLERVEQ